MSQVGKTMLSCIGIAQDLAGGFWCPSDWECVTLSSHGRMAACVSTQRESLARDLPVDWACVHQRLIIQVALCFT